jgi:3-dehydroquinate dehydratase/shikimate dehydrogenase
MICVIIARPTVDAMKAEHQALVRQGAALVELRVDYLEGDVNLTALLDGRPGPAMVTCRRPADGGRFQGSESARRAILQKAIELGAEYVDLEEDAATAIPRSGRTRRIVSHHDFQRTPDDLEAIHGRLSRLGADVVKVVTMVERPHDNLRLLRLSQSAKIPTVAFGMGEIGMVSRILAGKFAAPFTYAPADHSQAVAPGQLCFQDLKELYRYDQIGPQTPVYGVIADPVAHSMSPLIHNAAFAELGLDKVYVPLRIPPAELNQFLDDAPHLGLLGLSVTIPHKEAVLPKLTHAEEEVRGIGAANTLVFDGHGWAGHNTDCRAAMLSLELALGGRTAQASPLAGKNASPLAGKNAMVLGAGGVGKALAFGLVHRGAQVVLCDGMDDRAEQLAARLGCRSVKWADRYQVEPQILVNGTPLGMHPKVDQTPFEAAHLRAGMLVFDAVYNPEITRLLADARQAGASIVSGMEMFVRQAAMQFKLFTGHDGPEELMRQVIRQATHQ